MPYQGQVSALLRCELGATQQFGHADDAIHRRADLMAHIGQERAFGPVGLLGQLLGITQLLLRFLQCHQSLVLRTRRLLQQAVLLLQLFFRMTPLGIDPGKRRRIPPDQHIESQNIEQREKRKAEFVAIDALALHPHPIHNQRNSECGRQKAASERTAGSLRNQSRHGLAPGSGAEQAKTEQQKLVGSVGDHRYDPRDPVE